MFCDVHMSRDLTTLVFTKSNLALLSKMAGHCRGYWAVAGSCQKSLKRIHIALQKFPRQLIGSLDVSWRRITFTNITLNKFYHKAKQTYWKE